MAENELIETLVTSEGRNEGEAIGSWGRSIVFMPKGTPIGKQVCVRLIELAKKDSRGRSMYRAEPGPSVRLERWRDSGDGTASRIAVERNWLFEERELEMLETRPLGQRDGTPTTRSNYSVVWGDSLQTSAVEDHQQVVTPIEKERVSAGTLQWFQPGGSRAEPRGPYRYALMKVEVAERKGGWLEAQYRPDDAMKVILSFTLSSGGEYLYPLETTWAAMPAWWKAEHEAEYPVCSCGRWRIETSLDDGCGKCDACRAEIKCARCGAQEKPLNSKLSTILGAGHKKYPAVIEGMFLCKQCLPLVSLEKEIDEELPLPMREKIAEEAKRLLAGQVLDRETGLLVLKAGLEHIPQQWDRDHISNRWNGYRWYYFTDGGVYGSKLSRAALEVLRCLPTARGNGLIELVAWIAQGPQVFANVPDYYEVTQVEGRPFAFSEFEARTGKHLESLIGRVVGKLERSEPVLAERLRGSEADRIAAFRAYNDLCEKVDWYGPEGQALRAVTEILQDEKQDYTEALARIRKIESRLTARRQMVEIPDIAEQEGASSTMAAAFAAAKRRREKNV